MLNELAEQSALAEYLRQMGRHEGWLEAWHEGKLEGKREMAQIVLHGRFGAVPEDVIAAVRLAGEDDFDALAGLLGTGSLEQIRALLKLD